MSQNKSTQKQKNNKGKKYLTTIENTSEIEKIEDIFSYENPTIKDILVILKEIFVSQQFIANKYDELLTRNLELETVCNKLTNENLILKSELKMVKEDMQRIDNNSNNCKIEIHGIPQQQNENINEIILKIAENFDQQIKTEDIDEAYRTKQNKENRKNVPIVISFVRKSVKEKFLLMRRKRSLFTDEIGFTDIRNQIFINEYLSKKRKELFWRTKEVKIDKKYKFLWTKNGNIFIRKTENSGIIRIDSEEDLVKII